MNKCEQELHSSGEQVFDIAFHPFADLLAVATITGVVEVFRYGTEEEEPIMSAKLFDASCRGLLFSENGENLYTISADKSWKCINGAGIVSFEVQNAHDTSINKIVALPGISQVELIATGDDNGRVKLWDCRVGGAEVMTWKLHDDYVANFVYHQESQTLLSVAGDACLGVYDIRKRTNCVKSDAQESELLSVEIIKGGRKVVCGTDDGVMLIFSWSRWGDCSDRYPGHPESVDAMLKIDESTLFTGSSDGMIRAVSVMPNRVLGVVGDHEDFPVEGFRRSRDGRLLASYSHDDRIRFWDISMFADDVPDEDAAAVEAEEDGGMIEDAAENEEGEMEEVDEDDEEDEEEDGEGEWGDMSDDSDEDDDDDDSDAGMKPPGGVGRSKLPTASEKFFADL